MLCAIDFNVKPITWFVQYKESIDLQSINNAKQYAYSYEDMLYLKGDFSNAIKDMKNPKGLYTTSMEIIVHRLH